MSQPLCRYHSLPAIADIVRISDCKVLYPACEKCVLAIEKENSSSSKPDRAVQLRLAVKESHASIPVL